MWLLVACGEPDRAETDPPATTDTGPVLDTDEAPTLEVDLLEAGAAVQRAVDLLSGMGAQPLIDAYTYLLKDVEPACPNYTEVEGGNHFWDGACETSTGAYYHGAAFYYRFGGVELEGLDLGGLMGIVPDDLYGPGTLVTGEGFFGQVDSATKEGEAFRCSCRGIALDGVTAEDEHLWFSHTYGPITWSGADAAASWLGTDQRAHLSQLARYVPATGRRTRKVGGIVNGMESPYTSVRLDLDIDAGIPDACLLEPIGTFTVRDRVTGYWIEVALDVGPGVLASDPRCDGCGAATLNGEPVGTVCADFTGLTAFDDTPW